LEACKSKGTLVGSPSFDHFQRDGIIAQRQTVIEVVPFLVGLGLVVCRNIGAIDLHDGAQQRLPVLTLHISFDGRNLGQQSETKEQEPGGCQDQVAELHKTSN
jgi:hypothetical protein